MATIQSPLAEQHQQKPTPTDPLLSARQPMRVHNFLRPLVGNPARARLTQSLSVAVQLLTATALQPLARSPMPLAISLLHSDTRRTLLTQTRRPLADQQQQPKPIRLPLVSTLRKSSSRTLLAPGTKWFTPMLMERWFVPLST